VHSLQLHLSSSLSGASHWDHNQQDKVIRPISHLLKVTWSKPVCPDRGSRLHEIVPVCTIAQLLWSQLVPILAVDRGALDQVMVANSISTDYSSKRATPQLV
jgi:hypothetical protein